MNEVYRTIQILNERLGWYEEETKRLRIANTKLKSGKWVSIVLFIGSAFMMFITILQAAVCK